MDHIRNFIRATLVILAFGCVGWLMGYLVGSSKTPVVAASLPLIVGLLAGIGFSYADSAGKMKEVRALLTDGKEITKDRLNQLVGKQSFGLSATSALAIILFCVACLVGLRTGIDQRVYDYPSLRELLHSETRPNAREAATMHALRFEMIERHVNPKDLQAVFDEAVLPLFHDTTYGPGGDMDGYRHVTLNEIAKALMSKDSKELSGRNPASDPG